MSKFPPCHPHTALDRAPIRRRPNVTCSCVLDRSLKPLTDLTSFHTYATIFKIDDVGKCRTPIHPASQRCRYRCERRPRERARRER